MEYAPSDLKIEPFNCSPEGVDRHDTKVVSGRRIVIADYDATWPAQFEREAAAVRDVLGARAFSIDHVGSTSVPGLGAKPIVDILLVVADSSNEPSYVPQLEAAGYLLCVREPEWYEHRMFNGPRTPINLHVFSARCPEIDRMLAFRDWLRHNRDDRKNVRRPETGPRAAGMAIRGRLRHCQERRRLADPGARRAAD